VGPRTTTDQSAVERVFAAALEKLVADLAHDRSVLAAILCGSLSYDTVWQKSDIDLVLVTIDDRLIAQAHVSLLVDDVIIHAMLMPRVEFRKAVEGAVGNSFLHSFLAKGRLLYSHDPTIADLCAGLQSHGGRDRQLQQLQAGTAALPSIDKAHKWLVTRGDLDYTALWILYAATPLARIEVIGRGLLADREVIPQALALNPAFFRQIYTDLFNAPKTRGAVEAALQAVDTYMAERAAAIFAPVIGHLEEVGEARSCTEIEDHFRRHFDIAGVSTACEYLADLGLLGKASTARRLTKKSTADVQELAFFYVRT
jgi:hypothetical protein